jgi:hypothetical protein
VIPPCSATSSARRLRPTTSSAPATTAAGVCVCVCVCARACLTAASPDIIAPCTRGGHSSLADHGHAAAATAPTTSAPLNWHAQLTRPAPSTDTPRSTDPLLLPQRRPPLPQQPDLRCGLHPPQLGAGLLAVDGARAAAPFSRPFSTGFSLHSVCSCRERSQLSA